MANTIPFDTLAYAGLLQDAGIPQEQAKAFAKAQKQAFEQIAATQGNATKADMALLQKDIIRLESSTKADIAGLRQDMAALETRMMRWFIATTLTTTGVIMALAVGAATVLAPYLDILFNLGSLASG